MAINKLEVKKLQGMLSSPCIRILLLQCSAWAQPKCQPGVRKSFVLGHSLDLQLGSLAFRQPACWGPDLSLEKKQRDQKTFYRRDLRYAQWRVVAWHRLKHAPAEFGAKLPCLACYWSLRCQFLAIFCLFCGITMEKRTPIHVFPSM